MAQPTTENITEPAEQTTTFGKLVEGDLFKLPDDEQDRIFKRLPKGLGNLACDIRGVNDEITDTFSPGDRVVPLA